MRAKEISVVTVSKLGNSSGELLRTEHTPVTEPETAKHERPEPMQVGLTSQRCILCQFQMDESLSDTYGYSECSGKPSYNVSRDMSGSCIYSLTGTMWASRIYELDDPYNATIDVCVKLCRAGRGRGIVLQYPVCSVLNCAVNLGREGPGNCFTTTDLLSVKLCHQFGKRRAGELFYNNRSAQR